MFWSQYLKNSKKSINNNNNIHFTISAMPNILNQDGIIVDRYRSLT